MTAESGGSFLSDIRGNLQSRQDVAIAEAKRIDEALERRAVAREQNAHALRAKLALGVTPRRSKILTRELGFLDTYADRHPTGDAAILTHVWIKLGINLNEVLRQRNIRDLLPSQRAQPGADSNSR